MGERGEAGAVVEGLPAYDRQRLRDGLRRLTEAGAATLEVARVAVWLYGPDRSRLHRVHLYHRSTGEHVSGGELRRERFPAYFEALEEEGVLAVEDVHADPRTAGLSEAYATPLGLNSWIDAPIPGPDDDGAIGVFRFEQLGPVRSWSAEECSVARGLAVSVGSLVEYFRSVGRPSPGDEAGGPRGAAPGPPEAATPGAARENGGWPAAGRSWAAAARMSETFALEEEVLARAVEEDRLALRWQPVQRSSDGARVGAEALLRLRRRDDGTLLPAEQFVPRAEGLGLMPSFDRWVVGRAAAVAPAWFRGGAVEWVALNVSPHSLVERDYRAALDRGAEEEGLEPARVLLQVALNVDRHPTLEVGRALFSLWERGFGVCLDMVGAPDELMEIALTALPADVLEVTPEVLDRWEDGSPPPAIRDARAGRGLRLFAKRLETPDQERRARAVGCELLAGRLVGPAVEAERMGAAPGR